jgi:hypothetical protein
MDTPITRREALKGGSAAAVAVGSAYYMNLIEGAAAATDGDARIIMGDGPDPDENGEITFNDPDVKVFSGGKIRNLTRPEFESVTTAEAVINSNELYIQGTAPGSPSTGDIWIDNDG